MCFVAFFSPPGECQDSTLKSGHDRFLQNPFQVMIIHLSPYYRLYIVLLLKKRRKINNQITRGSSPENSHLPDLSGLRWVQWRALVNMEG
jgi:hypothetical protein